MAAHLFLVIRAVLRADVPCSAACAQRWEQCGPLGHAGFHSCCGADDHCVLREAEGYARCRPKADPLPSGRNVAQVLECEPVRGALAQGRSVAEGPDSAATSPLCNVAPQPHVIGSCSYACNVADPKTPAADAKECLSLCDALPDCNCALFDAEDGTCRRKWTPCTSDTLNLQPQPDGPVTALQPCRPYPLPFKAANVTSQYGGCSPMKLYPGVFISWEACDARDCTRTPAPAATLDGCIAECLDAGWDACRSVRWWPVTPDPCVLVSARVEDLGPHGTRQVLAKDGAGAVSASICEPPAEKAEYPIAESSDFGVDWAAVCAPGQAVAVVPDQQPYCSGECAVIPASRVNRTLGTAELYYQSNGLDECIADCQSEAACACGYFRTDEFGGDDFWCALSDVPCSHPKLGAQPDYTRVRSAIVKCGYEGPSAPDQAAWPEVGEPEVDWYGIWDYVCESPDPFVWTNQSTLCGPDCVLTGTHTTREGDGSACAARCDAVSDCGCAYWEGTSGLCSLMSDGNGMEGSACINDPGSPGALFFEDDESVANTVTQICCHDCDGQGGYDYFS